jgi:hypothetical protein
MEDERTQHPLLRVPPVDASGLAAIVAGIPGLRLAILNGPGPLSRDAVAALAAAGVCFDIAMLEGITGVARLVDQIGLEHVLFGSHCPYFTWESARLKMTESGLDETKERAIFSANAQRLLEAR